MYYVTVSLFMVILPVFSIADECGHGAMLAPQLVLKWYVFWAAGCRLFLAGARQILQPAFTAREILGHKSDESLLLVRELGFANLSIGAIALYSMVSPGWRCPAAVAAGLFYLLAGGNHVIQNHRNRLENVAMVSDLLASVVLLLTAVLA